jgi:ankyrin repeat protein
MASSPPLDESVVRDFVFAGHGDLATVRTLYKRYPQLLDQRYHLTDETALEAASHTGQREIAEFLLQAGARPTICTVAMLGDLDAVRRFLERDAGQAEARGAHGLSVLYHAAVGGGVEVAKLLYEFGCREGFDRALHGAIDFDHPEMVAWLLETGVQDLNAPDRQGRSPLAKAMANQQDEIALLLRKRGAIAQPTSVT